jgi:sec-independent protein translocase protein TatB
MFGMGWTEIAMIALVTLIFVGPKHLPKMMQKIGKIVGELRSASRELRNQIAVEAAEIERETGSVKSPGETIREVGRDLMPDIPSPYDEVLEAEKAANELNNEIVDDSEKTDEESS